MPWPVKVYRVKPTFIERRFCNGAFCKLFCIINAISWICVTNGTSTICWCCWSTKSIKGAELQRGEELKQNVFRNCVKTESHPQSNRSEVELLFLFTHITYLFLGQCYVTVVGTNIYRLREVSWSALDSSLLHGTGQRSNGHESRVNYFLFAPNRLLCRCYTFYGCCCCCCCSCQSPCNWVYLRSP